MATLRKFIYVNGDGDYQEHDNLNDGLELDCLAIGITETPPPGGITIGGNVDMNDNRITLLGDPIDDQDAVNKRFLINNQDGLDVKNSVRVATTVASGDIPNLASPPASIDGVTLLVGMRILVKDQTVTSENGIYEVDSTGGLVRASDADTIENFNANAFTFVEVGTHADQGWVVTTDITTLDVSTVDWVQFSQKGVIEAGDGLEYTTGTELAVDLAATNPGLVFLGASPNGELAVNFTTVTDADGVISSENLISTGIGLGATLIGINDAGLYFSSSTVEGALQEIGADLAGANLSLLELIVENAVSVAVGDLVYFSIANQISPMPINALHRPVGIAAEALVGNGSDTIVVIRQGEIAVTGVAATQDVRYYWSGTAWTTTQPSGTGEYVWQVGISKGTAGTGIVWPEFIKRNAV